MHMANELLSLPVAGTTGVLAAGAVGAVCRRVGRELDPDRLSLTGVLGAFVFAAQMINLPLPGLPGTSGHLVGAVLLAILLGPHAGALCLASVIIVQCLLFQDGGLLALGCNIINMALVPAYLGYALVRWGSGHAGTGRRATLATFLACLITVELGAALVVLETVLSGVITVPARGFLWTMLGVHAIIGVLEGALTLLALGGLRRLRPTREGAPPSSPPRSLRWGLLGVTLLLGTVICLWASSRPDGLEWSTVERPDQPGFAPVVHNPSTAVAAVDAWQRQRTYLPDYAGPAPDSGRGWTSLAGVLGSFLTMALLWAGTRWARRRAPAA